MALSGCRLGDLQESEAKRADIDTNKAE